ncbi:MAG: acyltransferase [Candidatus Hydrogenedentes bacterium]|nr:acyltransferase [Candidatus Hydrogenedentota bacterium]
MADTRRADIDWLRIGAVLLLVPFHTACVYGAWGDFYVRGGERSLLLSALVVTGCGAWHMPLLFWLAGASARMSLAARGAGGFLAERVRRLLVPFVFGVLVVVPPQSYLACLVRGTWSGGYFSWYPRQFFTIGPAGLSGYEGGFTPAHLWFVLFLFVYVCVSFPLLKWLAGDASARFRGCLAALLEHPVAFWLVPVPFMLAQLVPDIGDKNIPYFFLIFIAGFLWQADPAIAAALERRRRAALIVGLLCLAAPIAGWVAGAHHHFWVGKALDISYEGFAMWCLVVALVGYGKRLADLRPAILPHLAEGAYPFYILHQTIVVCTAFFLRPFALPPLPGFLIVTAGAGTFTALLYLGLVRPFNPVRFLFGMKPRRKRAAA